MIRTCDDARSDHDAGAAKQAPTVRSAGAVLIVVA